MSHSAPHNLKNYLPAWVLPAPIEASKSSPERGSSENINLVNMFPDQTKDDQENIHSVLPASDPNPFIAKDPE